MKSLRIDDTILHLDTITRVEFEKNDSEITADDQCAVFFIGNGNDPWVVRGKEARPLFEKLSDEMNAKA